MREHYSLAAIQVSYELYDYHQAKNQPLPDESILDLSPQYILPYERRIIFLRLIRLPIQL